MTPGDVAYGRRPAGPRLPGAARLGRVSLQVSDLERSLGFYERVLGLRTLERGEDRAALGAEAGAPLVELRARPGASPPPPRGRLGLYHVAILLPDRASLGRLVRHLGELGVRAGASDHRVSEAVYLQDPDGLGIEVYADRPRATWRHEGGELVMATEPLDLNDLLREAGAARWGGMPRDARIGHIHLHVGELASAAAFYHETLGLDQVVWSYPGALFLSAGGYHHHVGLNTWAGPGARAPADGDARLLEWEILLPHRDEVDAAAARFEAAGHAVARDAHGCVVADPWGTRLRLRAAAPERTSEAEERNTR